MYTIGNTVSISNLRKHTLEVLKEIENSNEPFLVFSRSQPKVVLLSYKNFESQKNKCHKDDGFDFLINPFEEFLIFDKDFDAVKAIRNERA